MSWSTHLQALAIHLDIMLRGKYFNRYFSDYLIKLPYKGVQREFMVAPLLKYY